MYRSMLTSAGATLALIATVAASPAQMADGPLVPMDDGFIKEYTPASLKTG